MKIIVEKEVGVGLEKDHFQRISVIEGEASIVVTVDQGQDQEQVQIDMALGVISVENMIILQKIALQQKNREIELIQ